MRSSSTSLESVDQGVSKTLFANHNIRIFENGAFNLPHLFAFPELAQGRDDPVEVVGYAD